MQQYFDQAVKLFNVTDAINLTMVRYRIRNGAILEGRESELVRTFDKKLDVCRRGSVMFISRTNFNTLVDPVTGDVVEGKLDFKCENVGRFLGFISPMNLRQERNNLVVLRFFLHHEGSKYNFYTEVIDKTLPYLDDRFQDIHNLFNRCAKAVGCTLSYKFERKTHIEKIQKRIRQRDVKFVYKHLKEVRNNISQIVGGRVEFPTEYNSDFFEMLVRVQRIRDARLLIPRDNKIAETISRCDLAEFTRITSEY